MGKLHTYIDDTESIPKRADSLIAKVKEYLPKSKVKLVSSAYEFAAQAHSQQSRLSGDPFIEHPLQTALYLANLQLDHATIAAALLHDVMEDCGISYDQLAHEFNDEIAKLVDGVTKLQKIDLFSPASTDDHPIITKETGLDAENLQKMFVAMAEDIRVVLVKLSDRLHNMRTLNALPEYRRRAVSEETLKIYAPLAHRLGIWDIKWQLEDIAFHYLEPDLYKEISGILSQTRTERENYIKKVTSNLNNSLSMAGLKCDISGRPKHIYSTYQKMIKYRNEGRDTSTIYDLYALRILLNTEPDCYQALGIIHSLWTPIPGQFDDYIARPRENTYQSLHTNVMCENGKPLEIQIRTYGMHEIAEYGVAAHWYYKEGPRADMNFAQKMNWLRQLVEWQREISGAEEFLESVMTDIFQDQTFVYTPKGDIIELPTKSTPIDFAYKIHTDLGHHCSGAKINGKLEPLYYQLQSGDSVEIIVNPENAAPNLDWLDVDKGLVRTASARQKIGQWFRKQERSDNITRGKDLLYKGIVRFNLREGTESIAKRLGYASLDELLDDLGSGRISMRQMVSKLDHDRPMRDMNASQVRLSTDTVMEPNPHYPIIISKDCCNPTPKDDITGFIKKKQLMVHKTNCSMIPNNISQDDLASVEWHTTPNGYPITVQIDAWDRVGLLRDITHLISAESVNITGVSVNTQAPKGKAVIEFALEITGVEQLSKLFSKLESVKDIISTKRIDKEHALL